MKKTSILVLLFVLPAAFTLNLPADGKKMNLFTGIGYAFSDFDGMFIDIGFEMQLTGNIYGQLLFDYYFNPGSLDIEDESSSAYGINLYGVYKHRSSGKMTFFAKAGVHCTVVKASAPGAGFSISVDTSDFGIGGGGGIEYFLRKKLSLVLGGTVKLAFSDENSTWYKIYCGFSYRLK